MLHCAMAQPQAGLAPPASPLRRGIIRACPGRLQLPGEPFFSAIGVVRAVFAVVLAPSPICLTRASYLHQALRLQVVR